MVRRGSPAIRRARQAPPAPATGPARRSAVSLRWWLDGDLPCGACGHWHAFGLVVHCCHCDDPICTLCVVTDEQGGLCPTCGEQ